MRIETRCLEKIDYSSWLSEATVKVLTTRTDLFSGTFKSIAYTMCNFLEINGHDTVILKSEYGHLTELLVWQYFVEELMKSYFNKVRELNGILE